MKHSTGKPTRLRHSTGYDWDELEKMKARAGPYRYKKPRCSTGEDAYIRHSTGREFDYKAYHTHELEREEKINKKVRSKPRFEGEEYLEKFQSVLAEKMRKKLGK